MFMRLGDCVSFRLPSVNLFFYARQGRDHGQCMHCGPLGKSDFCVKRTDWTSDHSLSFSFWPLSRCFFSPFMSSALRRRTRRCGLLVGSSLRCGATQPVTTPTAIDVARLHKSLPTSIFWSLVVSSVSGQAVLTCDARTGTVDDSTRHPRSFPVTLW